MQRQESLERRKALLDAALCEFSEKRYESASLNAILKKAGVSKGVFYYYFEDKRDLYIQLFRELSSMKIAFFTEALDGKPLVPEEGEPFLSFMRRIARLGAMLYIRYPQLYRMGQQFSQESEEFRSGFNEGFRDDFQQVLGPMIRASIQRGDFSCRFPPEFIERLLCYLLTHYYDIIRMKPDETPDDTISNLTMFFEFLEHGLSAGGATESGHRAP